MEQFRPVDGGLMPEPFISIKQSASVPALITLIPLCLFVISCFREDVHSVLAIKLVSLAMIIFLVFCSLALLYAVIAVADFGELPRHFENQ
jgi:uncharacterized membrane protein